MLNYIAVSIVPLMILITIVAGVREKKDVYELFITGVLDGLKVVYKIFPYVLGITVAIGLFKSSGLLDVITIPISGILEYFNIPKDILPLMILRPLSGSASMTMVIDILKNYGPDSDMGKLASIIMGSTETTIYTMTILYGAGKIKSVRGTLIAGLLADTTAIVVSVILINLGII